MSTPRKKHNKQHDARAASFKRIARGLRAESRSSGQVVLNAQQVAKVLDNEAKLLRSMR